MSLSPEEIMRTGLFLAVNKAGAVSSLAKRMGVSRQFLYQSLQKGHVPLDRAKQIEALTGIPARELIDPKLRAVVSGL